MALALALLFVLILSPTPLLAVVEHRQPQTTTVMPLQRISPKTVESACAPTRFPADCVRALSGIPGLSTRSPSDLAQASISASLSKADSACRFVSSLLLKATPHHGPVAPGREAAALKDCSDQLSQSLDELRRSLSELHASTARGFPPSRWQLANVETWVSAALTNDDTCLDGFLSVQSSTKVAVRARVTEVARATSNALYFINRLSSP